MEANPNPKVTVGLPTYNRPEGLKLALERVTSQTYKNLEIIISDNHSPDENAVRKVVEGFSAKDDRITFIRQKENLGSLRNFHFLLSKPTGDYFLWAADDDEIDPEYIESLVTTITSEPGISIAMTGYDVVDKMTEPEIRSNITSFMTQLSDPDRFQRMKNYVMQPDHYGKSRLVWGIFRTTEIRTAFNDCLNAIEHDNPPMWAELPIEFRMLDFGDLKVHPRVLFHVYLLPTSDGKARGPEGKKMRDILRRSLKSYQAVVDASELPKGKKSKLKKLLYFRYLKNMVEVFGFYTFQRYFPGPARLIKKIIFTLEGLGNLAGSIFSPIFARSNPFPVESGFCNLI